jgi:hypothetical protein
MSDFRDLRVEPVSASPSAEQIQPARERPTPEPRAQEPNDAPGEQDAVAAVGGHAHGAYAQYVVDPDTNDVVVRIRDLATDKVLSELPSLEVQAMSQSLREYAATLARRRLAVQSSSQA